MNHARAELLVKHAIGLEEGEPLPSTPIRQWLAEQGRTPRHEELYTILGKIRAELGYGSITTELAESLGGFDDIVHYLEGLPGEAPSW